MTKQDKSIRVAVVGATGLAGQQFVSALAAHPWFQISALAASARSAGRSYVDAIRSESGQVGWYAEGSLPESVAEIQVQDAEAFDASSVDLVFTAIDAGPARELEPRYAATTPVISTASAYRREADVPLLIPGVNMDHVPMLRDQQKARGWKGFITPNPNCTTVGLAITLAPLHRAFGVESAHMVSMQSVSGAGRSPGVIALDVVDNVIPFISGEEEKVEAETQKVLGNLSGGAIEPAPFGVSATCTRIAVLEGHTEAVHVKLAKSVSEAEAMAAWREFGAEFCAAGYPSAPPALIEVNEDPFRPQVRLDRDNGRGLTTTVGRVRRDPNVSGGLKYVLVSHNTKMGAALGCVLVAEHLTKEGYIQAG